MLGFLALSIFFGSGHRTIFIHIYLKHYITHPQATFPSRIINVLWPSRVFDLEIRLVASGSFENLLAAFGAFPSVGRALMPQDGERERGENENFPVKGEERGEQSRPNSEERVHQPATFGSPLVLSS